MTDKEYKDIYCKEKKLTRKELKLNKKSYEILKEKLRLGNQGFYIYDNRNNP